MVRMPILSAEAVRALVRATLGGPNCSHKDGFGQFLTAEDDMPLNELSPYFHYGPDTFLITYAIRHKKNNLGPEDITRAYCVDHIPMVQAAEKILQENGYEDEYFKDMRKRGFPPPKLGLGLEPKRLALGSELYLFSCIGKVGEVAQVVRIDNQLSRLRVFCRYNSDIEISNVVTPMDVSRGDYIAIHFASGFTAVSRELASEIVEMQQSNEWFSELLKKIEFSILRKNMNLQDWFGKDLAAWTEEQLASN